MSKYENRKKGGVGEEIAKKYLQKKGFKILETNFDARIGEIDLVAADRKTLVFVEVKLKVGEEYGAPEEMVNIRKIKKIEKAAQMYFLKNKGVDTQYPLHRIDVVAVVVDETFEPVRISHYENVMMG